MNRRSLIAVGLFVAGLGSGALVGRWSQPAARGQVALGDRASDVAVVDRKTGPVTAAAGRVPAAGSPELVGHAALSGGISSPVSEPAVPPPSAREITATTFTVARVIDGDTFRVEYDGDLTSVRIRDIDAPERGDPRADAATAELRRLVDGKTVRLAFGPGRKRDGFGRLLCRVIIDDLDVGQHLLDAGLVEEYRPGPRKRKTP
ncbi:MAG: thermonuclease family protein [Planctomycetota bacterium]